MRGSGKTLPQADFPLLIAVSRHQITSLWSTIRELSPPGDRMQQRNLRECKRTPSRCEFIQNRTCRPDIRALIGYFTAQLFRRHVRKSSGDLLGFGNACCSPQVVYLTHKMGQAEIENLESIVLC
jgi:hypothetical protein